MARLHGQKGRLYAAAAAAGSASPVTFLSDWGLDFSTAKVDVTSFEDASMTYVAGKPDSKGTYKGFYDDSIAGGQFYAAAVDGIARNWYLYPTTLANDYFFGTAFFDFKLAAGVTSAVTVDGAFDAATPTYHYP